MLRIRSGIKSGPRLSCRFFPSPARSRLAGALGVMLIALSSVHAEPVRVPGTRLSLEPPPGFVPGTQFQGFMLPDVGATIVVQEIPQPFEDYRKNFSREAIEARGMSVREHGRLTVDSFDALLVRAIESTREEGHEAWMLVFGDIRGSVVLIAAYPAADAFEFRTDIHDSLLSSRWDRSMEISDFEGLGFEIEESRRLKISSRFPAALVLTEDGRGRTNMDSPILVVSSAAGRFDFGNLEEFSRQQLAQSDVAEEITGVQGSLKSVAGMPGYEIVAEGVEPRSGASLSLYQLIVGEKGRVYIFQGFVGPSRARDFIPEFRAVAESFRPKP